VTDGVSDTDAVPDTVEVCWGLKDDEVVWLIVGDFVVLWLGVCVGVGFGDEVRV